MAVNQKDVSSNLAWGASKDPGKHREGYGQSRGRNKIYIYIEDSKGRMKGNLEGKYG